MNEILATVVGLGLVCSSLPLGAKDGDPPSSKGLVRAYVGTYTGGGSEGVYLLQLDMGTGRLSEPVLAGKTLSPSFLAFHPSGRFLYAVNETSSFEGEKTGSVSAFAVDRESGKLTLLNRKPSGGGGPCHIVVDRRGKTALIANYGGGSVTAIRIEDDGRLGETTAFVQHEGSGPNPRRQEGPHAHCVNLDASNRFLFVADLGTDKVVIYRFDPEGGTLQKNDPPWASLAPGAGPRHLAFRPDGRHADVITELQSTVTAFAYDPTRGALREIQTISTLPEGYRGRSTTAEIVVSQDGRFLYGSNRGHDSIAVFRIDPREGTLRFVEHESTRGKTPRNFAIDPSGRYILAANQGSHNIVVFRIHPDSGALEPAGHEVKVTSPVCVVFPPRP